MTFLDAARVARIVRHRSDLTGQHTTEEIVHVITSLPADLADPATLAAPAPRTLVDQIPAPHPRRHLGRRRPPRPNRSPTNRSRRDPQHHYRRGPPRWSHQHRCRPTPCHPRHPHRNRLVQPQDTIGRTSAMTAHRGQGRAPQPRIVRLATSRRVPNSAATTRPAASYTVITDPDGAAGGHRHGHLDAHDRRRRG